MLHFFNDLKSLWYLDIVKRDKKTPFWIFVSFLVTYGISRSFATFFSGLSLVVNEYHIHHFFYGFGLLLLAGWMALVSERPRIRRMSAIFLGIGAGLVVDEIGLLLTCTSPALSVCDYYARDTFDVFILLIGFLLWVIYSGPFYRFLKRNILRR